MGKRKGGKKSRIEGAQRSRSQSKSESKSEDAVKKPAVVENKEEKIEKTEELPVETQTKEPEQLKVETEEHPEEKSSKTAINRDVFAATRNDSECGSLIVECGSPAKSALQLLAEIDNSQEQSSMKNALELLDEIDQTETKGSRTSYGCLEHGLHHNGF